MKNTRLLLVLLIVLVPQCAPAAPDPWTQPDVYSGPATLPSLGQSPSVDGDLSEWEDAASVPLISKWSASRTQPGHEWKGPADASMEVYCAWSADGLCLAGVVADDEIINTMPDGEIWKQDCVELYLDGRVGDQFMKQPYSPGAYQILLRPPTDKPGGSCVANPSGGKIEGLKTAWRKTDGGYSFETLVPWSAFPAFTAKAGAHIAFQFAMADYDSRDGKTVQPITLSYRGLPDLFRMPDRFILWELADNAVANGNANIRPQVLVGAPNILASGASLPVEISTGSRLSSRASSVTVSLSDSTGKQIAQRKVVLESAPTPWQGCASGMVELPTKSCADGYYTLSVSVIDRSGAPIGTVKRTMLSGARVVTGAIDRIKRANIATLSQAEPFKAAAYLGAAACVEKFKRMMELSEALGAAQAARELAARLDLLESGKSSKSGMLDLLNLTADAEAQVAVEYPSGDYAVVTVYWGSMPIASAYVVERSDEEAARKAVTTTKGSFLALPSEPVTIAGAAGSIENLSSDGQPIHLSEFAPEKMVLMTSGEGGDCRTLDISMLSFARADGFCVLPGCASDVAEAVQAWAKANNVPALDIKDALSRRTLVAGDIRATDVAKSMKNPWMWSSSIVDRFNRLRVASGRREIGAWGPSALVAKQMVGLVVAGKSITLSDVDRLRMTLVRTLGRNARPAAVPSGARLHAGDLHMHTFYSDGWPSPAGIGLEALYCYMDFSALTDHNTLDGALVGRKLLSECGFAYPFIIGEEVTNDEWHMNAYPLKEVVSWTQPINDASRAAHAQGAATQWNHPGFPQVAWQYEHMRNGLTGIEVNAWEHLPSRYDEWKAQGKLPIITGTTDTHNSTFMDSERTAIVAASAEGADVASAVKSGRAAAVTMERGRLVYGPDDMTSVVWAALAEGKGLREAKAQMLRDTLRKADVAKLLSLSQPTSAKP